MAMKSIELRGIGAGWDLPTHQEWSDPLCRGAICWRFSTDFSLDFRTNRTDNLNVITDGLIYSPSDLPKGLWRGFVFSGTAGRMGDAC
jgi:hypothetical protein